MVVGAAEFAESIPPDIASGTVLRVEAGELWGTVGGFEVRLGRPIEMRAKALSLAALLEESIPEGSTLILVAPSHPAVSPPPLEEGLDTEDDDTAEVETSQP